MRRGLNIAAVALTMLGMAGCRSHDFPQYPANYREFAYVTNGGSDTVSIFDVVNVRLDRQIEVGRNPSGVTANPKRNEVYVVNAGDGSSNGSISVVDAAQNAVVATIPVHRKPYSLDVDPSGNLAYVANSGSNSVSVIDLNTRREISVTGVGEAPGVARVSPDGRSLVVTNSAGNSVSILQTPGSSPAQVRKVITGCPEATDVVILPDSSKAFVACSGGHQVMAIALAQSADVNHAARPDELEALLDVGRTPVHLALKPDGGELFVSNFDSNSITEIATSTDDVGGTYLMGSHPVRGLVTSDNALLFESDFSSQDISLYSIDDGKRIAPSSSSSQSVGASSIHVGDGPDALAFSASGNLLFAVDARSGDLAVIRTSTQSLFTLLPTGRQPNAIAIKSFRLQ